MLAINDTKVRVKYVNFMISLFSDSLVGGLKDSAKDEYESVKWEHSGRVELGQTYASLLFILFFLIIMFFFMNLGSRISQASFLVDIGKQCNTRPDAAKTRRLIRLSL